MMQPTRLVVRAPTSWADALNLEGKHSEPMQKQNGEEQTRGRGASAMHALPPAHGRPLRPACHGSCLRSHRLGRENARCGNCRGRGFSRAGARLKGRPPHNVHGALGIEPAHECWIAWKRAPPLLAAPAGCSSGFRCARGLLVCAWGARWINSAGDRRAHPRNGGRPALRKPWGQTKHSAPAGTARALRSAPARAARRMPRVGAGAAAL